MLDSIRASDCFKASLGTHICFVRSSHSVSCEDRGWWNAYPARVTNLAGEMLAETLGWQRLDPCSTWSSKLGTARMMGKDRAGLQMAKQQMYGRGCKMHVRRRAHVHQSALLVS